MNYFVLFNLPEKFEINLKKLTRNFYKLQKQFHPDLSMKNSKNIQTKFLNKSIYINAGYKILKNPIQRSEHLLSINGITTLSLKYKKRYNNFLKIQFFLYEQLDKILKKKNEKKLNSLYKKINNFELDNMCKLKLYLNKKLWNIAIYTTLKLKFFENFKKKIKC
ncbi:Fe-S protein assembly co-chaperone HscB [Buchnera aphidicola]|uniref:Co-chaperone protein HscB n=1 Tax=Buchnera aphidicola (Anoecia oenotherae) TaxID=1241833 RepID=A0A4D6Y165_9GAMM|nr:Fe-S protein assembly co-chaperone HscB [Buchnera aphidicola]QCI19571.1 Fe-S protein assembly co-chaperone HscB [Buchnera aphidicola (Anoecia oenotherae)]